MTRLNGWRTICGALSVCVAMANPGQAQTFRMLFNFDFTHGAWPTTPLAQGVDGNLYGTTYQGSVQQAGVLFRVDAAGSFRVLHNFCSQEGCPGGHFPWAGLLLASDGNFYGTTMGGTIFRVTPADEFTTVYKFHPGADGYEPEAPLIEGADGNLYGTTYAGQSNSGAVFRLEAPIKGQKSWSFKSLYDFTGPPDGALPAATVIFDRFSNLYGTTTKGGTGTCRPYGCGTVFEALH